MPEALRIPGATSRTLLGYLVGLGVLRIVARHADTAVRASWTDDALVLHGRLDAEGLSRFLLDEWIPSPVVSPWNGGSGFFGRGQALELIEVSESTRLEPFRQAIRVSRRVLEQAGLTERPPEPKLAKPALLRDLRRELPDDAVGWLDAAVVLVGDDIGFPPVLVSGGNDGNYDFSNNFAQAVVAALSIGGASQLESSEPPLRMALWRTPAKLRKKLSLAHLQRDASPVNSPGGESDALGNPWELALAVEGTLLLAAGAGRRLTVGSTPGLVAPFTLRTTAAGYGSAATGEKGKAELWMPTWRQPASLAEVERLFKEGRVQVGRRAARSGLDAARAAGELGVARGVDAFRRFSILERSGNAHLAVPAGRIEVRARPAALALRTLDPWLGRVIGYGAGDIPRAQREAIQRLERTAFTVAERGDPDAVARFLACFGKVEGVLARADARSRPAGLEPIAPDATPWLEALDPPSQTLRVALGLASVHDPTFCDGRPLPALRDYLFGTGLDPSGRRRYDESTAGAVPASAPAVVRLAAVHERRHLDAAREDLDHPGFRYGIETPLSDLEALVHGRIDLRGLDGLIDGLALLHYPAATTLVPAREEPTDALLGILALGFHDRREPESRIRVRPGWAARLRAGQVGGVATEVLARLRQSGRLPLPDPTDLQIATADGPRLAAALLARPRPRDLRATARRLTIDTALEEVPA